MSIRYITDLPPKSTAFFEIFDHLFPPEKLTFLGILFNRIYSGMVNSEDKCNRNEVSEDGYILTPDELDIDSCGDIAFELVHMANDCFGGSFPRNDLIDCLDTWITRTPSLDEAEHRFNILDFGDKLYALTEIFCQIGGDDIGVDISVFDLDGYWIAHTLLEIISVLYPSENEVQDLPF